MGKIKKIILSKETIGSIENIASLQTQMLAVLCEKEESLLTEEELAGFDIVNQINFCKVFFSVVIFEEKVVAVCRYALLDDCVDKWIEWQITTREGFKGKGYASLAVENGNNYIKQNYAGRKIIATIWDWNTASLKFHSKLGYKNIPWGELKDSRYDDGEADEGKLLFEREL